MIYFGVVSWFRMQFSRTQVLIIVYQDVIFSLFSELGAKSIKVWSICEIFLEFDSSQSWHTIQTCQTISRLSDFWNLTKGTLLRGCASHLWGWTMHDWLMWVD